jgi:HEXXH motif-containing protein
MTNLQNRILATLNGSGDTSWFPGLATELVIWGWEDLFKNTKVEQANYSTAAVLHRYVITPLPPVARLQPIGISPLLPIQIDETPHEIAEMYGDSGALPYTSSELRSLKVIDCANEALQILASVPSVYESVSHLVASLHLLKPELDEVDVSFSLPEIPFSIFVSVPQSRIANDSLRVAEAILHEAMHLQLTLIEQLVPLVEEADERYFSPWKNQYRHPRGVLHALYVFTVIKQFLESLLENEQRACSFKYIEERLSTVISQRREISDFDQCLALTSLGQKLVEKLLVA